jgi:hypothetical protein
VFYSDDIRSSLKIMEFKMAERKMAFPNLIENTRKVFIDSPVIVFDAAWRLEEAWHKLAEAMDDEHPFYRCELLMREIRVLTDLDIAFGGCDGTDLEFESFDWETGLMEASSKCVAKQNELRTLLDEFERGYVARKKVARPGAARLRNQRGNEKPASAPV